MKAICQSFNTFLCLVFEKEHDLNFYFKLLNFFFKLIASFQSGIHLMFYVCCKIMHNLLHLEKQRQITTTKKVKFWGNESLK